MSKKKRRQEKSTLWQDLKDETLQAVIAIICFVLAIFLTLSAIGLAGILGNKVFSSLDFLLGIGYYILPILFILLGVSFLRSLKQNLARVQTIAGILFFISSLGIIGVLMPGDGGVVGKYISSPLTYLIDVYATLIILTAILIISILIMFDLSIRLHYLAFWKWLKKKEDEDEVEVEIPEEDYEEDLVEEDPVPEPVIQKSKGEDEESIPMTALNHPSRKVYTPPPLSLLEKDRGKPGVGDIKANANIIKRTLLNFGIHVEMDEISIGPSVTRYALKPAEGVKLSKIVGLQNELALALAAHPVRIEAPIPGTSLVGIEIPNSTKTTVGLATLLASNKFSESAKPLLMALGKGISGASHLANLAKAPHLLIAGATGSGKSVTIHALINSLLFRNSPDNLKFIMVDPKRVELTMYNKVPHLLTPVITDAKKTILALKWAAKEMERRYDILESESVRDIESYHKNIVAPAMEKWRKKKDENTELPEQMPYIVIIIDELADIMQAYPRELESAVVRLAQMSRAVGIHLILSTQRPSVNVITGLIKANIPSRIALQVSSQIDSRTILDMGGAEKLLGAGDMLYLSGEMAKPSRIQSAFITETEVKKVVGFLSKQYENEIPEEIDINTQNTSNSIFEGSIGDEEDEDGMYEEAKQIVLEAGKASTSYLQRKLRIGYSRAARLIDMLEERGIVGPADGSKPREVLNQEMPENDFEEEVEGPEEE